MKKRILSMVLALAILCSMLPMAAADGFTRTETWSDTLFTDVAKADWFYENVKEAYELGLMVGYGDGTFNPTGAITMAQTVAVAARVHAIATKGEETFEQGAPWYQVYVDYAKANGILGAAAADYDKAATRLEFARILAKAMPEQDLKAINDVKYGDIPDVADDEAVYKLYRAGVLMGNDEKGTFAPESTIQRSEMAAIVTRMALPELRIEKKTEQKPTSGNSGNIVIRSEQPAPEQPAPEEGVEVSAPVESENGAVKTEVSLEGETVKATVPAGVALEEGTKELTLSVSPMEETTGSVTAGDNEALTSFDVHIDGVSADNTVVITVSMGEILSKGLNMGNVALYHVENGETNAMTQVNTLSDLDAHNEFYYDPATGEVTVALKSFSEVTVVEGESKWEGNFDYSWYTNAVAPVDGEATTEYIIANADQLAAFGAIVGGMNGQTQDSFAGKTVKLISDINLGDKESENNPDIIFYPIGYYNSEGTYERTNTAITSGLRNFEGTFDGNGHTIANFYQNTWEMKGDHDWYSPEEQYYRDGMGLFGKVYGGTVKNLTIRNFKSDGEITTTGCVAAYADGATFENIAIFDCNPRVYNIGNGGIVGCVGWYAKDAGLKTTFTNITVDNSNKISALWGSWDVACGGLVGQYYPTSGQSSANYPVNAGIHMVNCHVSAQMDVYNDVCANYQYYAYRYAGMLIGSVRENEEKNGHSYPKMDGITASGCTVHFGDWNDYYYCELVANSLASYTHDHQMSRLVEIKEINGTTITYLDGTTGTVPASGRANYVIVDYDKGHGTENATCYHFKDGKVWNHEDAGYHNGENGEKFIDENNDGVADLKEDKQHIYLEFNNLVTGYGWGVTSRGLTNIDGVENMDITQGEHEKSVEKFKGNVTELSNNYAHKLGDIFTFVDNGVELVPGALTVTVTNLDESNPVSAEIKYDTTNWENGTITFDGTGNITITIQDYYFCTPTTITVEVTERQPAEKFDVVMNNGDFLHRVGNSGTVGLDKLFKAKDGVTVGTVSVTVEAVDNTGASGTYSNNAIQFNGTGVVKVTITDNDYCTPTELYLEVVDAVNATAAVNATDGENGKKNNVVLLNDIESGFTVSGDYTVYGNGFTLNYTGNGQYLNNGLAQGIVAVSENGTLDNLRIKASIYPAAYLYYGYNAFGGYVQSGPSSVEGDKTRYHYQLSAVAASGNATISNCYIYGGRNNIYISTGNVTVKDTILECAPVANVQIQSTSEYTVTFENVTTIQHQMNPTLGDTSLVMLGTGVLVGPETTSNPTIVLNGSFKQYNWVTADDATAVSNDMAKAIINGAVNASAYNHTINDKAASNLGIVYMNTYDATVENNTGLPYVLSAVELTYESNTVDGQVCSLKGATESQIYSDYANADRATVNGDYLPTFTFDLGDQVISYEGSEDTRYLYGDANGVTALYQDSEAALTLDLSKLATIYKYTGLNYTYTAVCKDSNGNKLEAMSNVVTLSDQGNYTLEFTAEDNIFYDKDGNRIDKSVTRTFTVPLTLTVKEASIKNAEVAITKTALDGVYTTVNLTDYKLQINFLDCISVTDYDENGTGTTVDLTTNISSASLTPDGVNVYTTDFTATISYTDGRTLTVNFSSISGAAPGSPKTATINTSGGVYFITDSALDNKPTESAKKNMCTITSVSFKGNSRSTVTNDTDVTVTWELGDGGCVTPDTIVTLADGTQKEIQYVTYDDELLVWNFNTGDYAVKPASALINHGEGLYRVVSMTFDDGSIIKIIDNHGFFDTDANKFVFIDEENVEDYIGHSFAKSNGNGFDSVKLVGYSVEEQFTTAYSILSHEYDNAIVGDLLSVTPLPGIDNEAFFGCLVVGDNMTYDFEAIQAYVDKHGLYTYEELAEYDVTYEQYVGANLAYLKIMVGEGLITLEYALEVLVGYVPG